MARGWESKAVEDQIEEGKRARLARSANPISDEERARQAKLASLELSRSRLLEQLEKARLPAHRNVLLNGLKAIERQLEELRIEKL